MWVRSSIASLALVYCSQRLRDSTSIGLSFHCLSGSWIRIVKRKYCSSSVMENQYLMRMIPERTSMRSNSGTDRKNSSTSSSVQKPITRSTPARLYQLRSNSTISPPAGKMRNVTLEIPLRALALARRRKRGDVADPRIEPLGDALDDAALAGGIAALENHHHLELLLLHPALQFHQFALQAEQLLEVDAPVDGLFRCVIGELVGQRVETIVVDLQFQFLIKTVQHFRLNAVVDRRGAVGGRFGHGRLRLVAGSIHGVGGRSASLKAERRSPPPGSLDR